MKPKDVYLKAAQDIASGQQRFSCVAILERDITCDLEAYHLYAKVMSPSGHYKLSCGNIINAVGEGSGSQECRDFRVLLLTLMAHAYEDVKGF